MNLNKTDKVYHDLLKDIQEYGHEKGDRTGTGTKSVFGRQIRFNMKDGFPLLTTKKLYTRGIIHELLWFLNGDTNIKYLQDNKVTIWDEWADENGDLGPVYGKQWVNWENNEPLLIDSGQGSTGKYYELWKGQFGRKKINQIQNLIDRLETHPDCRRLIVSAWNVGDLDKMALAPCHNFFQVYTRELSRDERIQLYVEEYEPMNGSAESSFIDAKLTTRNVPTREISLMWNQRSVDTFLGLPFNIASYALLLQMIAQQVNMVPGELVGNLGDTHLYSNHIDYVEKQLKRESKECNPEMVINKAKDIFSYKIEDFELKGYEAHPNWKNVPIAV